MGLSWNTMCPYSFSLKNFYKDPRFNWFDIAEDDANVRRMQINWTLYHMYNQFILSLLSTCVQNILRNCAFTTVRSYCSYSILCLEQYPQKQCRRDVRSVFWTETSLLAGENPRCDSNCEFGIGYSKRLEQNVFFLINRGCGLDEQRW